MMPNDDGRPMVSVAPLNLETAPDALDTPLTRTGAGYTRNNFAIPQLDAAHHRIAFGGAVRAPVEIAVEELAALAQRTHDVTMECAGNDRVDMRPLPGGEPWKGNALSTSRWTGVPLRDVLEPCGIDPAAVAVLATGADGGHRADHDGWIDFARAIPIDVARSADVLLALRMNDEPLQPEHGAPVRLIVPRWYGMASVKWVTRIDVLTHDFDGYFQRARYVYDEGHGARPVTRMRVKSRIVAPADGARLGLGDVVVWGWAWSGDGPIERVEVAVGGDGPWVEARLEASTSPYAWTRWEATITLDRPGRYVLRSRARDVCGHAQPDVPRWNRLGYGNNAVRPIVIDAVAAP